MHDYIKDLENEMERWRIKLDELKLKGKLAKLEAKDEGRRRLADLESRYDEARDRLEELKREGTEQAEALRKSVDAAWDSFKKTYEEAAGS